MDLWALCATCDRWFYQGQDPDPTGRCPVCGTPPVRVEDRDESTPAG